jgi:hypothetical protein
MLAPRSPSSVEKARSLGATHVPSSCCKAVHFYTSRVPLGKPCP